MARPAWLRISVAQWGLAVVFLLSIAFVVLAAKLFFSSHPEATQTAMEEGAYVRMILATGDIEGKPSPVKPKEEAPLPPKAPHSSPTPVHLSEPTHTPAAHEQPPAAPAPEAPQEAAPAHTPEAQPAPEAQPEPSAAATSPAVDTTPVLDPHVEPVVASPSPPAAGQALDIKDNPALLEPYKDKFIPKKAEDGSLPCESYARPDLTPRDVPVIGLLVSGLGINQALSTTATEQLPPQISLSFSPYSTDLQSWIARSHRYGHEAWLDVPMEFADYPASDPGPLGLLKKATETENLARLKDTMATAKGYVGMVAPKDEIFTGYTMMEMMHHEIANRGLLLLLRSRAYKPQVDASSVLYSSRAFTKDRSAQETQQALSELETIAKDYGYAVGVIDASPTNFATIMQWSNSLSSRNIALVPLSAIPARHR